MTDGTVQDENTQPDEAQDDGPRARVANAIAAYLLKLYGEPEISGESLVYTQVCESGNSREYTTTPYNVAMTMWNEDGVEVTDQEALNIIGFTFFAETGYKKSEGERLLPGFIATDDTIILDDESGERLSADELAAKIDAVNEETTFRNEEVSSDPCRPAFNMSAVLFALDDLIDITERNMHSFPDGVAKPFLTKLQSARVLAFYSMTEVEQKTPKNQTKFKV
ncbi:MAG: hypothetical protein UY18_C0030G0005 [Microgenomates group bacterium GW2011_GWF2_47_9]|nr:MAG: hypothetical protein UY18_C0030G0005 [Microgenomates group bacterium GW2011_GWF2_47_9]